MGDLDGLNALVTGGTRGIGAAVANCFKAAGARVFITGKSATGSASEDFFPADFSKLEDVKTLANSVRNLKVDILVNNAGINRVAPFVETDLGDLQEILQVNLVSPFLLCQAVLPFMKQKGWGRIVNISSVFGKVSKEQRASYSASKFGIDGMTVALAAEVARYGVLANSVSPGFIDTELTRKILGEKGISKMLENVPIARLGQVDEIAELVLWLCSRKNSYVSGQNYTIDGGFTRV